MGVLSKKLVALALITLAAVVIFNAADRVQLASAGDVAPAAFVPLVVGNRPPSECSPAYPTICLLPPPPNINCPQLLPMVNIPTLPPDPHGLDADKDGIGCESDKAAALLD